METLRRPRRVPAPLSVGRVDFGPTTEYRFNASVIDYRGRTLLAYRTGWAGARISVTELRPDLTADAGTVLEGLGVPGADYGQEDPRLFVYRDRLHVGYTGVQVSAAGMRTGQFYAELSEDFRPVRVHTPAYAARRPWEKNWVFFARGKVLYAVYSVMPHRVLQIHGDRVAEAGFHDHAPPWSGGHMRGGASPVLVGDRYYHWFHGRDDGPGAGSAYNTGVMTFAADPPFRVLAVTPTPLMKADPTTKPDSQHVPVVFACGAVLRDGVWTVSYGVHDRWTEVARWDAAAVDAYLVPIH